MRLLAVCMSFLLAMPALSADIHVENAWIRAPMPGQSVVGGFLDITSPNMDAVLVSASSPVAGVTELHEMHMKDGVMTMHPVPYIRLPKGQTVRLAPGGLHIMLMDLKKPLKAGDKVSLTLKVLANKHTSLHEVNAEVRDPLASSRH